MPPILLHGALLIDGCIISWTRSARIGLSLRTIRMTCRLAVRCARSLPVRRTLRLTGYVLVRLTLRRALSIGRPLRLTDPGSATLTLSMSASRLAIRTLPLPTLTSGHLARGH